MKSIKLKLVSILLILASLLSFAVACGEARTPEDKPEAQQTARGEEAAPETGAPEAKTEGTSFDVYSLYSTKTAFAEVPKTFEAWIKMPKTYSGIGGCMLGNYRSASVPGIDFRIEENGQPKLYHINWYNNSESKDLLNITFNKVNVCTNEWLHLTIVDDVEGGEARCYIDGALAQTVKYGKEEREHVRTVPENMMCIGGDFSTANAKAFKGVIRSIAAFSDVRTEDEIKADMVSVSPDEYLIASYDLTSSQGESVIKDLTGRYDAVNNRNNDEWLDPEKVPFPEDFAYSIAILGDPQIVTGYNKEDMHYFCDWLLENKEKHKIEYVLNVGDITDFNYDEEWEAVREEVFRLNGKIPYALVRGDHDILQGKYPSLAEANKSFSKYFDVSPYKETVEEWCEDLTNSYRRVEICGNKYLIMTLDKNPSGNVLKWAGKVIEANPDYRVIITTHCFLKSDGTWLMTGESSAPKSVGADVLWSRLLRKYANIEFIISGHMYAWEVVWTKKTGDRGNVVNQILVNPQGPDMDREGVTCSIAMLYFSADGKDVQVRYYSTLQDKYVYRKSQFSIRTDDDSVPKLVEIK